MRKHIILALVCCASVLAGCQKEMSETKFESGLPASLDVLINLGKGSDVVMTRGIYDYESEINELMLIMFSEEGRKMVIDLTGKLDAGSAVTDRELGDSRTYKLTAPVTTDIDGNSILSGIYEIYAVANWSSPFCGLTKDKLAAMDKAALAAAVASNSGLATGVTGSQKFPMTGHVTGQKVVPDAEKTETNKTSIEVSLKRLISHIEFKFVNGQSQVTTGVNENPQFVPHSYSVYNLPKKAFLMSRKTDIAPEGNIFEGNVYGNVKDIEVTGSGGIEFFMLENVQAAGTSTTYEARDVWTGTQGAAPENKTWTNAPANSTFIVVKGEYTGASYIGNVEYTIHLGNFSARTAESYKNFTVNRNEYQKYTVTVNGVSKIVAEVTGTEQQPGAEGVITAVSNQTNLVLDSHYESCLLKFSLSGCQNPTIIVKSPYNAMNRYEVLGANNSIRDLSGVDYGWVKFGKPASTTSLNAYPADGTGLVDIRQLALELKTAEANNATTADHFLISGGKVYVQAYVDEYYYSNRPDGTTASWPEFVNAENRVLILNPTSKTSADGNSTLYPTYLFQISQRSIRTTYKTDNASIEAFGIETWNETGRSDFGSAGAVADDAESKSYGWQNNRTMLGTSWPPAATTLGYTTSVTSNDKSAHVYYTEGVGTASLNGYNACMARNRDENGDGVIDDTELKWYLPAINQYLLLWCGEEYLYGDTRLVDPADISKITETDYNAGVYNLYNSSYAHEYWAVEGVSYGPAGPQSCGVRCIRNLKTYNAKTQPISSVSGNTITITGVRSLRQQAMSGEYASHNDRDPENNLYKAFEVATSYLPGPYSASQVKTESLCASYSQDSNGSDVGQWRIPNQKELMIMGQNGFLDDIKPSTGNSTEGYASRTEFIRADLRSRTNPYFYMYWNGPTITVSTNNVNVFRIRCVRDVTQ